MRILQYSLGLYPERTGGLTKYSTDLIEKQSELKHELFLLYPGKIGLINKKMKIKKEEKHIGIEVYELINALPIPVFQGINNLEIYTKHGDKNEYTRFLLKIKPDIIHIHTLMGLHKEFLEVAHKLKIKVVFTTHDFFGLCPKTVLFKQGSVCESKCMGDYCEACNTSAFAYWKLLLIQSHMYKTMKNSKLLTGVRRYGYKRINNQSDSISVIESKNTMLCDYEELDKYYKSMFSCIDFFIFNSSISENVYRMHINIGQGSIIHVIHRNISDNRSIKSFNQDKLTLSYLTSCAEFKGFYMIKSVIAELNSEGYKIELNVYNDYQSKESYINSCGMFRHEDLPNIYSNTDILVVPSLWYETFSFLVLEGFSFGVPVLLTTNVGAKDIIQEDITGIIIEPSFDEIKKGIIKVYNNRELLEKINKNIVDAKFDFSFNSHVEKILEVYSNLTNSFRGK